MDDSKALDVARPLRPPKKWVDGGESSFERVRTYVLFARLGSQSFQEFERGAVTFPTGALADDGDAVVECECPQLAPGARLTAREFIARAYGRCRQYFDNELLTEDSRHPLQGDVGIGLLDAKGKQMTFQTSKLRRQAELLTFDADDSPGAMSEVRESAQVTGSVARHLASSLVTVSGHGARERTETERLLNERIRITTEDMQAANSAQRDITADAIIAADTRARAEEERKALARERELDRGWFERFLESDTGQEMVRVVGPALVPAAATTANGVASALSSLLDLFTHKAKAVTARAKREAAAEAAEMRNLAQRASED